MIYYKREIWGEQDGKKEIKNSKTKEKFKN